MPDSSFNAYILAKAISVADWVAWCDVQLTKDGVGICLSDIRLDNSSDVNVLFKNKQNTYLVNGVPQKGWFSVDFNFKDLALVSCKFNSLPFTSFTICFRLYGAIYVHGCLDQHLDLITVWAMGLQSESACFYCNMYLIERLIH